MSVPRNHNQDATYLQGKAFTRGRTAGRNAEEYGLMNQPEVVTYHGVDNKIPQIIQYLTTSDFAKPISLTWLSSDKNKVLLSAPGKAAPLSIKHTEATIELDVNGEKISFESFNLKQLHAKINEFLTKETIKDNDAAPSSVNSHYQFYYPYKF